MKRHFLQPITQAILTFFTLILLYSCSKKEVAPADQLDALSNTTWEAYGFNNPVNNKDVYYYLAFSVNGKGQTYSKYNKTESTDIPPNAFTYTINGTKLTLTYPDKSVELEYTVNKIKISSTLTSYTYTKL